MIASLHQLAVVPILVGPLQVFLAMLPAILFGIGSALLALFKPRTFKLALRLLWRMKVSIVLAIALLTGTVFAARAVWRNTTGAVREAEANAHDWPLFRGNARRTGAAESSGAPLEGGLNWAFAGEAKTFYSSPTVVGNRVYATSAEVGVFSNRGAIYCLDADTGGVVWKSVPEGMRATFSSPCVSGKYLVTGEGLHQVRDGRVTCLDITRGGAVLWTFRTKSHVESSAAIADGRAIIGAGDDGYYCFRLEPDAKGNPVLLWHLPGSEYHDAESDPIVYEGRAYLGLGINGQAVVCVDAASGRELWRVATSAPVFSPPMIARGKLFIGMGHGDFVNTEQQVIANTLDDLRAAGKSAAEIEAARAAMPPGGEAWCIDLATHQVEWKFKTDSTVLGAIVAGADRLFIASRAGTVHSVGFDGKLVATWNARAPIIASLAATASHVYALTESGRLFALEQTGLQPIWETRLGNAGTFLSSPAIARGHVYAGSPEDGLLCAGRPAGPGNEQIWAGELGGAGAGGNLENASFTLRGEIVWRSRSPRGLTTAPVAALGTRLAIPVNDLGWSGLACLDFRGGSVEPAEEWMVSTRNGVNTSPAASSVGMVFSEREGSEDRQLIFLSPAGTALWSAPIEPNAFGFACLTSDAVLAEQQTGSLTSLGLDGKVRWRQTLKSPAARHIEGGLVRQPVVLESLIVATSHRALCVLDRLDGSVVWRVDLPEVATTGPIVVGKSILFATVERVFAYRLLDGQLLWQAKTGPVQSALVACGELVAATTSDGELLLLNANTGEVLAKERGAYPDLPPLAGRDALLYAGPKGIMRFDLASRSSALWLSSDAIAPPASDSTVPVVITSPLIVTNGTVCFATDRYWFVGARNVAP
ncbi:MAG TPA: PQQ-binding-like beta-propeller repeat protein [Chthoniobacteraceae bacterium]|jgi:outer membrane protein assembly factor BamB|nr:PQQ-binding-like beta-propeller repeat protein [Chthoniobacteraceae bacterium]